MPNSGTVFLPKEKAESAAVQPTQQGSRNCEGETLIAMRRLLTNTTEQAVEQSMENCGSVR
jgi:hypothetical protein